MILDRRRVHAWKRAVAATLLGFLMMGHSHPAFALDRSSTMADWSGASAEDQRSFIEALGSSLTPSFKAREDEILACVSSAAQASAHATLPIVEIAKACAEADSSPSGSGDSKDI